MEGRQCGAHSLNVGPDHGRFRIRLCVRVAVRFHVVLGGLFGVLLGVDVVSVRQVGVVSGGFVVAVLVMLGGFVVMARSVLVVLRCLLVMLGCFVGHEEFLSCVAVWRHGRIIVTGKHAMGYSFANSR
jgi:hypothetical protein